MALYLDTEGRLVESEDDPERLAASGYTPAAPKDLERALGELEYEELPASGKVAETLRTGFAAAERPIIQGLDAAGLDMGYSRDEQGNMVDPAAAPEKLFDNEARLEAERHPIAAAVGQGVALSPLALTPGGLVGGVLGEAAAGGIAAEAENAWLEDREFAQEAAFLNVGAGLLVGGGILAAGAAGKSLGRLGRNLFTEGEHSARARAARDLLEGAPKGKGGKGLTAEDIAARGADDPGVSYLRDNADKLTDELADKQARAAQELIDSYGELSKLRPDPDEVAAAIPDLPIEQARWTTTAKREVETALEGLPDEVAKPLREKLGKLTDGDDPAKWFTRASELSDDLQRAKTRAARVDEALGRSRARQGQAGAVSLGDDEAAYQAKLAEFRARREKLSGKEPAAPAAGAVDMGGRGRGKYGSPEQLRKARVAAEEEIYSHNQPLDRENIKSFREVQARIKAGTATEQDLAGERLKDELFEAQGVSWSWTGQGYGRGDAQDVAARQVSKAAPSPAAAAPESRSSAASSYFERQKAQRSPEEQALRDKLQTAKPGSPAYLKLAKQLEKLQKQGGSVSVGDLAGLASSPMGNVVGAGAGAAIGDQIGEGHADAAAGGALGFATSLLMGRGRGAAGAVHAAKELLDAGLKDEGLWGAAARAEGQRAAGYARRYGEHLEAFENAFTSELRGKRVADPTKFREMLADAASEHTDAAKALRETLESARATADVAAKFGRKEDAARILKAIDSFETVSQQAKAIGAARKTVSRETAPKDPAAAALEWLAREGSGQLVDKGFDAVTGAATVAGAHVAGPLGAGLGMMGGRYLKKQLGETVRTGVANAAADAAAGRLANRSAVFRAAQSMASLFKDGNRRGVQRLLSRPLELAESATNRLQLAAPTAAGVTALNYDATRDHIEKMATDPAYFAQAMGESFGTLPEAAPEVFSALSAQAAKVVNYLNAVAPGGKGGGPFGERVPVGEDELWEFNERMRAATDPEFIREELARGALSSQAIEAFELMNPKAYAQLQRDVFERLHELQEQEIPVPIQAREQIDVLLNIDGGGDPALTWKVAERAYLAMARKEASQPTGGSFEGTETSAMTSGALSTLGNGASAIAQTG
jgi:hypothetical protein